MATRTVSQTGNLSNAATFGGSAFSDGDDIVNPAGSNFVLTVDQNATVAGFSGTGGNGQTLVNSGITLTLTGNVVQGNKSFTLGSGTGNAHLVFDCTAADRKFLFGDVVDFGTYANCILVINGTSGAHCTVSKTGSNYCWFDEFGEGSGGSDKAGYDCTYCDFTGIGKSDGSFSLAVNSFGIKYFRLSHCTFTTCGTVFKARPWSWNTGGSNKDYYIRDCKWTSSTGTFSCEIMADGIGSTGARDITRNSFDKKVNHNGKMELVDNLFGGAIDLVGVGISNVGNLYYVDGTDEVTMTSSCFNSYWMAGLSHHGNPHCFNSVPGSITVSGCIFEYPIAQAIDSGECVYRGGDDVTIRNCLCLPSETDGNAIGALSHPESPSVGWITEHNTIVGANSAQCIFTEGGGDPPAPNHASVKSNLVVDPVGNNGAVAMDSGQPAAAEDDFVLAADIDYNGKFGPLSFTDPVTSNVYSGYKMRFSSGLPGVNDITADPQFVDPTRNFANWSVYKGAASSGDSLAVRTAATLALLVADPTLTRTDLMPWIRAGFAPTNPVYQNAGHDGVTIGAVEGAWPSSGVHDMSGGIHELAGGLLE